MRKVLFKKWIPRETEKYQFGERTKNGTGRFMEEFTESGLFHQWAATCEESSEGFGNYTVALIELPNGEIIQMLPSNLKFINEE